MTFLTLAVSNLETQRIRTAAHFESQFEHQLSPFPNVAGPTLLLSRRATRMVTLLAERVATHPHASAVDAD